MAVSDDPTWFEPYYEFPNGIVIYESHYPQPGIVLLSKHYIDPGKTSSRAQKGVNIHAGEESEFDEKAVERQSADVPARATRRVDGLGADEPRRRIVTVQAPTREPSRVLDPKKPLPKDATPAEKKAWYDYWTKAAEQDVRLGLSVRGWRMRALSAESEVEFGGKNLGTQAKLSALFRRIPPEQKAWLEGPSKWMQKNDPYFWLARTRNREFAWTPWVKPECAAWLVVEGAKLGLFFAARATEGLKEAEELKLDVNQYLRGDISCEVRPPRDLSIGGAARVFGLNRYEPLSMSAMGLFEVYQRALKEATNKRDVHEAYHRILLHRFLRRRLLVPTSTRSSEIGKESERRANLLQAHRVFVFNSNGCPTRLNSTFLESNGIGIKELLAKNPLLMYSRDPRNRYLVNEWTAWLFRDVLKKDPDDCRSLFTSESMDGLSVLAGLGILG